MNNVAVSISFIRDALGIRLENMGAEDVASGNLKMIMGLLWSLISHYQLRGAAGTTPFFVTHSLLFSLG